MCNFDDVFIVGSLHYHAGTHLYVVWHFSTTSFPWLLLWLQENGKFTLTLIVVLQIRGQLCSKHVILQEYMCAYISSSPAYVQFLICFRTHLHNKYNTHTHTQSALTYRVTFCDIYKHFFQVSEHLL